MRQEGTGNLPSDWSDWRLTESKQEDREKAPSKGQRRQWKASRKRSRSRRQGLRGGTSDESEGDRLELTA